MLVVRTSNNLNPWYIVSYSLLNLMMASELAETCRSINNIVTINLLCFDLLTLYL